MLILVISCIAAVSSIPLAPHHVRRRETSYDRRSAQTLPQYDDYDPEDQVAAEASDPAPSAAILAQPEVANANPIYSRVGKGALARILAAAGAGSTPISRGVSYGKRQAEVSEVVEEAEEEDNAHLHVPGVSQAIRDRILAIAGAEPQKVVPGDISYLGKRQVEDSEVLTEQTAEAASEDGTPSAAIHDRVGSSWIARILAAADAKPKAVELSGGYGGKRAAEDDAEIVEGLVESVPLSAVKIKPHGSEGNIHQQFHGSTAYQTSVHSSRFGRVRREDSDLKNFIPFHVYDDRRVKTLKVEQNDFLALKGIKTVSREKEAEAKSS
jgi:hypothetical protein